MSCADVRDLAPAYVLGALDRAQEDEVRAHLVGCPEAHEELAQLSEGVSVLMESVPQVEPPPSLRSRILADAARDLAQRGVPAVRPPVDAHIEPAPTPRRSPLAGVLDALLGRTPAGWAVRALAVVTVLALGAWNLALQGELSGARSYQERLESALALARQPGAEVALLAPPEGAVGPTGVAVMPREGHGRLVMSGLQPTRGSQIYEAWAIPEGGAPIPVGGFRVGADGVGYFDELPAAGDNGVVVAITLEPAPNPTAPSSDPIAVGVPAPLVPGGSSS